MNTKTLMDQLAAELAKPKKQQHPQRIKELNLKLDKALGTELKDEGKFYEELRSCSCRNGCKSATCDRL